eukprot:CCRYP_001657-RA/>CCRYP_001657-RA protein AED:0.40 eAED:-0.13 QI:0/0/0/0.5/0.66/0.5/4/0/842
MNWLPICAPILCGLLYHIISLADMVCRGFSIVDIFLEDPSLHLRKALDDLLLTATTEPDPFDSVLSSWVRLSGGDYVSSPVVGSWITQWNTISLPPPTGISSKCDFGRHSWRLRRHFRHVAQRVSLQQDRLLPMATANLPPLSPGEESLFIPSDVDVFLSSFHPAIAGIRMLTLERIDHLRFLPVWRRPLVTVSLRSCHDSLVSSAMNGFVFPAMMETVLHSVGGFDTCPLIVDSGASCCISPCRGDFGSGYASSDVQITDLSSTNKCLLTADSIGGGHGTQDASKYRFHLNNDIVLDGPYGRANLPVLPLSTSSDKELGFWTRCFSFTASKTTLWSNNLLAAGNTNLSPAQKELLLWHYQPSHAGLSTIHNLLHTKCTPPVRSPSELVPLCHGDPLPCKYKPSSLVTDCLLCAACEIAKAKCRRPQLCSTDGSVSADPSSLKAGHTSLGDCFSCDHYISPTPGRMVSHSGHSSTRHGYVGGTISVDQASQWIFHSPQHSLNAANTLCGKLLLEREAADVGATIRSIHTDNGVFNSKLFCDYCSSHQQKLRFSRVDAHHQNGVAENAIRTISYMARTNLIHASLRWTERSLLDLWPFAMPYAIWYTIASHLMDTVFLLWNCGLKSMLDPTLQDGKKIPKWNSSARQGIFVGFLPEHSSLVPLVFNPRTQRMSPQYHVIFDDGFSTVPSLHTVDERDRRFEDLFHTSCEPFLDPSGTDNDGPPLSDNWLSPVELLQRSQAPASRPEPLTFDPMSLIPRRSAPVPDAPEGDPPSTSHPSPSVPEGVVSLDSSPPSISDVGDDSLPVPLPPSPVPPVRSRYPTRVRSGDWKDGPALDRSHPFTKG